MQPPTRSASAETSNNCVRFLLDGKVVRVTDQPPTTTVLDYLRTVAQRTGTKEGCAEGDCGACTVVLGELDADQAVRYRAINSCIRFLPTIDGKELITVESLQDEAGGLHPVQRAMVDQHASQCGFCTPGFVMSLFALYQHNPAPQREQVVQALSGNLCRCTGYRPIIDAGCQMHAYPPSPRWSNTTTRAALQSLRREQALQLPGFSAPRTVDELAEALAGAPQSLLLAGGTDIGLWVTKHLRELPPLIYLGEVAELQQVQRSDAGLRIGAAVALQDAWAALVAWYPQLTEQAQRFASPPVCNSGTLCGNLANGSPIGDSLPALIALDAVVELRRGAQTRHLPLPALYLGYQQKALQPGEFVVSVTIKPPPPGLQFASYKVAKRIDQDISAVSAGFAVIIEAGVVVDARLAFGGMAATARLATHAQAALLGQPFTADRIDAAIAALVQDFQPLTDLRASSDYRLRVAGNLLRRFHLQSTQGDGKQAQPLRTAALP